MLKRSGLCILLLTIITFLGISDESGDGYFKTKDRFKCKYFNSMGDFVEMNNTYLYIGYRHVTPPDEPNGPAKFLTELQLYFKSSIYYNCLGLSKENREFLLEAIEKYKKWNQIAIENEKAIDRLISKTNIFFSWSNGVNKEWRRQVDLPVAFSFFSQSKERHQFVISFGNAEEESYKRDDIPTLYFEYEDVLILEKYLTDEYIEAQIEQNKLDKIEEDRLFN